MAAVTAYVRKSSSSSISSKSSSGVDELQVLKPACDSPVAIRVEGIEGYRGFSVDT